MKLTDVPAVRRIMLVTTAVTGVFFTVATAVHVPAVGKLVARVAPAAATCPMGGSSAPLTAAQQDENYAQRARLLAGEGEARELQFLGLQLGEASSASVRQWAHAHGLSCRSTAGGFAEQCDTAEPQRVDGAFAKAQSLTAFFAYSGKQTLVEGRLLTRFPSAALAAQVGKETLQRLQQQAGATTSHDGEFTASFLDLGLLRQARATFRRANLYATVSSTNFGNHYDVIEEKQALLPPR